jgi:hypothetical protein
MSASANRHSEALGEFKTPLSDRGMETRILERASHFCSEDKIVPLKPCRGPQAGVFPLALE